MKLNSAGFDLESLWFLNPQNIAYQIAKASIDSFIAQIII